MFFTTGNLITLGLVAVVLFVYRQLDRDNRSLEKVKKFTDRLRDELAIYVDKRSEDLQRYGIELDVQQKAAKEALKRLQTVEEGLSARADSISDVEKRLGEYDGVLARLMDMTARVDENLLRIREESDFAAGLARKLEASEKTLDAVESEIPALRAAFSRDAETALETFRSGLLERFSHDLAEARAILDRARADAEATLTRAEDGRRGVDREITRAFELARVEAEKLEDAAFEKLRAASEAKISRLRETVEEKFAQIGLAAKDKAAESQTMLRNAKAEWKTGAEELLAAVQAEIGKGAEELGKRLDAADAKSGEIEARVDERFARVDRRAEELAQGLGEKLKASLTAQREDLDRRSVDAKAAARAAAEELAAWIQTAKKDAATAREGFKAESAQAHATARGEARETGAALAAEIRAAAEAASAEADRLLARFTESAAEFRASHGKAVAEARSAAQAGLAALAEAQARVRADTEALGKRVLTEGEGAAARALEEIARRLGEYGSEVEGKFARLEAVQVDVGALETALRAAIDRARGEAEAEFGAFGTGLEEKRRRFEEAFTAEAATLRQSMRSLEEELAALKTRAYENVSEKLSAFEDAFFSDLNARSAQAEFRLQAWKTELDEALGKTAATAREERLAAERAALDELRARVAESRERVMEQLAGSEERARAMRDGIGAEAEAVGSSLAALRSGVEQDLAAARKTAEVSVTGSLALFTRETEARVAQTERQLAERLGGLAATVGAEEESVRSVREEIAKAAEEFRAGFARAVAEADARSRAELEAFRQRNGEHLEAIKGDYESQREAWLAKAQSERDRIQSELAGLADRGADLRKDLQSRMTEALEGFRRESGILVAELEKRRTDAREAAETSLQAFRDAAQDLSLKVDAARAQSLGRVDSEAQRLSQTLADIDREQKAYVAQSKVFERTEELRTSLAAALEGMQADLARAEGRRAEFAELESQVNRVKRLEEETSQKVARFLAEKRRVDALEEDFGRLAAVAKGVDQKLEELTGQGDALTDAQAAMRKALDLAKEAEVRYERLEKKTQVLEATTEAVDKNFQSIQGIEKLVGAIGAEARRLPERIAEIKRSVDELAAGRERTEEAARTLGELDGAMADIGKRMAEAQKVREWLARAETRLEEVNRQAQEQLKLLSTLLKDEGQKPRDRGAPPSSVQDTVRKLARQGWNADEIARAVKVSRGEVELILELGGKV